MLVTADRGDNVHRIFESLNNTGLRLSQADLLRNHLFMCLPTQAERIYTDLWLPLERDLGDRLEQLMWLHLVLTGDERVRRQDLYVAQQERLHRAGGTEAAVESYLRELTRRAPHLRTLTEPDREPDQAVRDSLRRLASWPTTAAYPALMALLEKRELGELSTVDLATALGYMESFLVRRMICKVAPNSLARIFEDLPAQLPADQPVADGVRWVLSGQRRSWPTDEELRTAIRTKRFYQQGQPAQRKLVLQRLEESHEHPEPVDFAKAKLTIEHVLPQTPTQEWLDVLAEDGGDPVERHRELLHTLGNLTLTAVNATLSNHPFQRKQDLLAASHLELNRQIAGTSRWGAGEILARAEDLADRAIRLWPGPVGAHQVEKARDWSLLHRALAALPAGGWTTYGEMAALIDSHPRPVGVHLANTPGVVNAHRVLGFDGRVSATFRWADADRGEVLDVLRADGVRLDEHNTADWDQWLSAAGIAELLGLDATGLAGEPEDADDYDIYSGRFEEQLEMCNPADEVQGVDALLSCWLELGGRFGFGDGAKVTSCFLLLDRPGRKHVWPFTIYPTYGAAGYIEVVFLHLATREPFTDPAIRDELRLRLNKIPGIDIPASKLALRPSFPLTVLADPANVRALGEILRWFRDTAER